MGEKNDRRRGGLALQVVSEPGKLFGARRTHTAGLEVCHFDQPDDRGGRRRPSRRLPSVSAAAATRVAAWKEDRRVP
jgi:hypothetical protein